MPAGWFLMPRIWIGLVLIPIPALLCLGIATTRFPNFLWPVREGAPFWGMLFAPKLTIPMALVAYATTLVVGMPILIWLRYKGITSLLATVCAGMAAGPAPFLAYFSIPMIVVLTRQDPSSISSIWFTLFAMSPFILLAAVTGGLSAGSFWVTSLWRNPFWSRDGSA